MGTRFRIAAVLALIVSMFATTLSASAFHEGGDQYHPIANDRFEEVWERTDYPVEQTVVDRTWIWGPGGFSDLIIEDYEEGENGERQVQYFDKSRMEMPTNGEAATQDEDSPWFITQGLLAYELMTGNLQLGDEAFEQHEPANIPVAGDPDDTQGPTYEEMGQVMNLGARTTGWGISQVLHRNGSITDDSDLLDYGVTDAYYVPETEHNIASVFWEFMNSTGTIYENGQFIDKRPIFRNAFYAVGFPLTEAYWADVKVDDVVQDVLIQCFERRCLTYTPDNPKGWEVESGNIGQHYYNWRYNIIDREEPEDPPIADDFEVSPESATNQVGETHEITVSVEDQYGDPFEGADVAAEVTDGPNDGTDLDPDEASTGSDGEVILSYDSDDEGTDTITISVEGIEDSQTVSKTWEEEPEDPPEDPPIADDFVVNPVSATNQVGEMHEVTVSVEDQDGEPFAGADVSATVTEGPNDGTDLEPDDASTGDDGEATLSYEGTEGGIDTITVSVEGIEDDETVTKTWCDAVVEDGESIQDAINAASEGDLICVESGTYVEDVSIDVENVTLLGVNAADSDDAAVIDGSVSLDADGTELRNVVVTHTGDVGGGTVAPFGIRVQASDTTVAENIVRDLTGSVSAINGIQVFGGTAISDITVEGNTVTGFHNDSVGGVAGIKLQADLDDVDVTGNTVTDLHSAGWVWGVVLTTSTSHPGVVPKNVTVTDNTMEDLNDGDEFDVFVATNDGRGAAPYPGGAFGIDGNASADEVTLENNNLLAPNGAENKDASNELDAECNWWGDTSGPTHDDNPEGDGTWAYENPGDIDYDPWLVAPAPDGTCTGGTP